MTPNYLNSPPPPPPPPFPLQLNEDQQHHHHIFSPKPQPSSSSSSSSLTCPLFFNPAQDQGGCYYRDLNQQPQPQQEAYDQFVFQGGSYDHPTVLEINEKHDNGLKLNIWKTEDRNENHHENGSSSSSVKWMSSKMRVMQKMMISDQTSTRKPDHSSSTTVLNFGDHKQQQSLPSEISNTSMINSSNNVMNSNNNAIRVCADCNTTKTPLWRSGPRGPKSLCNACGIRQRKARRAMAAAAAAAAASGTNINLPTSNTAPSKSKAKHKDKRSSNGHVPQYKKRYKLGASRPSCETKKLCLEDFTINLSKNTALHRVFPQDEIKEAAILLMALSCGLVHG